MVSQPTCSAETRTVEKNTAKNDKVFWHSADAFLAWVFGIAMLLAAVPHLENSYYFLGSIYAYRLVDPGIAQMTAMVLPLMQLVIAIMLIGRVLVDAANFIAMGFFGVFSVVQSLAYFGGLDISCGCFGPQLSTQIGWTSLSLVYSLFILSVIRNAVSFFICTRVIKSKKKKLTSI